MNATIEYLRNAIEHAPKHAPASQPGLRGWYTPDGHYVCAPCASRIMARGCHLPKGSDAIWSDGRPAQFGECVTCAEDRTDA